MAALWDRIVNMEVPIVDGECLQIVLGIINCIFFGVGVLIAGLVTGNGLDVIIGLLQLVVPFVGWLWALVWGVLMVLNRNKAAPIIDSGSYEQI